MNRFTGAMLQDENAHIQQSVADILLTPIGSRIQRRDYGSLIPQLIDNPINRALLLQLSSAAVMALTKWEKRIAITAFKPQVSVGKINATLIARRTDSNQQFALDNFLLGNAK